MKLARLFILSALLLATLILAGCGDEKEKAASQAAPQKLNICSSLGKNMTELLVQDFVKQSKTKITPNITYIPAGSLEQRMEFIRSGNFDCWLGATAEEYFSANERKLLEPYAPEEGFKVPLELRNRRNLWTSLYLTHIAIISNKNKLHSLGLYAPTAWNELLDKRLQEQIAIPNYSLGGSSFGMITSIWQLRGKDEALKYAAKLNQQKVLFTGNALEAADAVYKGKKTLAVLPLEYAIELEEKHPHLYASVPKDANRNIITGVALLDKAGNTSTAQSFISYLMSDNSEKLLQDNNFKYIWHTKNYSTNSNHAKLVGKIQIPMDDLAWTSTYKGEIIRQWTEAK